MVSAEAVELAEPAEAVAPGALWEAAAVTAEWVEAAPAAQRVPAGWAEAGSGGATSTGGRSGSDGGLSGNGSGGATSTGGLGGSASGGTTGTGGRSGGTGGSTVVASGGAGGSGGAGRRTGHRRLGLGWTGRRQFWYGRKPDQVGRRLSFRLRMHDTKTRASEWRRSVVVTRIRTLLAVSPSAFREDAVTWVDSRDLAVPLHERCNGVRAQERHRDRTSDGIQALPPLLFTMASAPRTRILTS
jgi:hypothetical protein